MKNMDLIVKKLTKAAESYSKNTGLRAAVNAIPYIGGSLDVLFSSKGQKIIGSRLEYLLNQIKNDMANLKDEAVDRAFLDKEEFFDIVRKVFESTVKTRNQEKIKLYSKILRAGCLKDTIDKFQIEDYLSVLTELSTQELVLARALYEKQKTGQLANESELEWAYRTGWRDIAIETNIPQKTLDFVLKRLERTGLIKEITGSFYDYSGGVYVITETFRDMMKLLNN